MPTFAEQMVAKLEAMLLQNAGLAQVDVDGQKVAYADLEAKHAYWRRRMLRETGKVGTVSRIRLDRQ